MRSQAPLLISSALLVALFACGGNSTPAAPAPKAQPTPSPTPTTTTPAPAPSNAAAFQAIMLGPNGQVTGGQVSVNASANNGSVVLQLKALQPATSFEVNFCPSPAMKAAAVSRSPP